MSSRPQDLCPHCRAVSFADKPQTSPEPARRTPEADDVNDHCPVCHLKFSMSCRCRRGNRGCPNGHQWRVCKVHRVRVLGTGHDSNLPFDACCCPKHSTETPGGAADMSGAVNFVFDLDDPVVRFH